MITEWFCSPISLIFSKSNLPSTPSTISMRRNCAFKSSTKNTSTSAQSQSTKKDCGQMYPYFWNMGQVFMGCRIESRPVQHSDTRCPIIISILKHLPKFNHSSLWRSTWSENGDMINCRCFLDSIRNGRTNKIRNKTNNIKISLTLSFPNFSVSTLVNKNFRVFWVIGFTIDWNSSLRSWSKISGRTPMETMGKW